KYLGGPVTKVIGARAFLPPQGQGWRCLLNGMRDNIPPSAPPSAPAPATPHEAGPQYFGKIQEPRRFRRMPPRAPTSARASKSEIHLAARSFSVSQAQAWMTPKTITTTTAMRKIFQ